MLSCDDILSEEEVCASHQKKAKIKGCAAGFTRLEGFLSGYK